MDSRMKRVYEIAQVLADTQFESRYDELLDDLAAELLELSGVCGVCEGTGDDEGDPCPACAGQGFA